MAQLVRNAESFQYDFFHITPDADLTLYNLVLRNGGGPDRWGGGSFVNWGTLQIYSSLIEDSLVNTRGGAIFNNQLADVYLVNTIFRRNEGYAQGGAIFNNELGVIQGECIFFDDNDSGYGGGIYHISGGFLVDLSRANFIGNSANSGGALYNGDTSFIIAGESYWNTGGAPSTSDFTDDSIAGFVDYPTPQAGFVSLGCEVPLLPAEGEPETTSTPEPATQTAEANLTATPQAGETSTALWLTATAQITTLTAQAAATQTSVAVTLTAQGNTLDGEGCGPANEPWWRLQRHNQNDPRPSFPQSEYPNFPRPPDGTESHHPVTDIWMRRIFGDLSERYDVYDPDDAFTILMPERNHNRTRGRFPRPANQNTPWQDIYENALDNLDRSSTPPQCRERYWEEFRKEAADGVRGT